jgi:L-alanine-DL-glutamate epimerase-like enolase superfamily enzyme
MPRSLYAQRDTFPLKAPFRIARGVKTQAEVVTVTIVDGDVAGRGEAVPYPRYGESPGGVLEAIESVRGPIERGRGRDALLDALPAGAARNALDCALWDLESRLAGRDVAGMTGGAALEPVASALTISIDAPEAMAQAARRAAHVPLLKVKVDASDPEAQIRAVRAAAPGPALIVDPNESWDRTLVVAMQGLLVEARVALLEQPVPVDKDAWLEGFAPAVPICADESFHVAADLPVVTRRYQAVNVKLDKTGGLTEALAAARAARAAGLGLMTGCMISSSLSIAPALHIAQMSDFVDLDGPLWLREDYPGGIAETGGIIRPPLPGFWGAR